MVLSFLLNSLLKFPFVCSTVVFILTSFSSAKRDASPTSCMVQSPPPPPPPQERPTRHQVPAIAKCQSFPELVKG